MKLLFIFFTVVSFISTGSVFSQELCEDIKVGEYKKSLWGLNLTGGLQSEFYKQLSKRDHLFDDLTPEISFSLADFLDMDVRFSRKVVNYLPIPLNDTITPEDTFNYRIKSQVDIRYKAGQSWTPMFASSGEFGLNLVHLTSNLSADEQSRCQLLLNFLDRSTEEGREFYESNCQTSSRGKFSKYYDKIVDFVSIPPKKLYSYFANTKKSKLYAEDPLSPLRLHSLVGVPIDHKIFFEANTDVAIGDIIEHTTHYSLSPIGASFSYFPSVDHSYSRFKRFIRRVAFKKSLSNHVEVEIQDTQLNGDTKNFFKISPKLFSLIRLNLGKWGHDKFQEQSLTQKFEIDLNQEQGLNFFKKILLSSYRPNRKVEHDQLILDHSEFKKAVTAYPSVYSFGNGKDKKFKINLLSQLLFESTAHRKVSELDFKDQKYSQATYVHNKRFKNRIRLNLGFFKIPKKDSRHQCQLQLTANEKKETSLNFECKYTNRYSNSKDAKRVANTLYLSTNGVASRGDVDTLKNLQYKKGETYPLTLYTHLSFSQGDIKRIVESSPDRIRHEFAKALFGDRAENIFGTQNESTWKKIAGDRAYKSGIRDRFKSCATILKKYNLVEDLEYHLETNGIFKQFNSLYNIKKRSCFEYYNLAKSIEESIMSVKDQILKPQSLNKFLDIYSSMKNTSLIQNMFIRLSRSFWGWRGMHYTYMASSSLLLENIQRTNGKPYELDSLAVPDSVFDELSRSHFPRVKTIKFLQNTCAKDKLKVQTELNYSVEDYDKLKFSIAFKTPTLFNNGVLLHQHEIFLKDTQFKNNFYSYTIDLPEVLQDRKTFLGQLEIKNDNSLPVSLMSQTIISTEVEDIEDEASSDEE